MSRLGCNRCFATLDCNAEDDGLSTIVYCTACGRQYHQKCWNGNCMRWNCSGTEAHVEVIPPPAPLPEFVFNPPSYGGPVNCLDDEPLGITAGTVVEGQMGDVLIRNNSEGPIDLSPFNGPPWATIEPVREAAAPGFGLTLHEFYTLEPGQQRRLVIELHRVRPPDMDYSVTLAKRILRLRTSSPTDWWYSLSLLVYFALLLLHWWLTLGEARQDKPQVWAVSWTLAVLLGYAALLSPGWTRALSLWLTRTMLAWLDELLPVNKPATKLYAWLGPTKSVSAAERMARHLFLVVMLILFVAVTHRVLIGWWQMDLMGYLCKLPWYSGLTLTAVVYLALLQAVSAVWLRHFDVPLATWWYRVARTLFVLGKKVVTRIRSKKASQVA